MGGDQQAGGGGGVGNTMNQGFSSKHAIYETGV